MEQFGSLPPYLKEVHEKSYETLGMDNQFLAVIKSSPTVAIVFMRKMT